MPASAPVQAKLDTKPNIKLDTKPDIKPDIKPANLKSDEVVVFIPTFAVRRGDVWKLPIEAWVYEPEQGDVARNALLLSIRGVAGFTSSSAERARILENLRPFIVDNERGKHVVVRVHNTAQDVGTTGANGRVSGTLLLPVDAAAPDALGFVRPAMVLRSGDARRFEGQVQLLADDGISVISDIDDTIKISEVHSKSKLLRNTFAKVPVPVPGMAQRYRSWRESGAAFHYVSNSPLPLLSALTTFIETEQFPLGSLALKPFRWTDGSFLRLFEPAGKHKQAIIEALIGEFSARKFVLVGDTGEADPEIYAEVAARFSKRVVAVYLRDTGSDPNVEQRLQSLYAGHRKGLYRVFREGNELPALH